MDSTPITKQQGATRNDGACEINHVHEMGLKSDYSGFVDLFCVLHPAVGPKLRMGAPSRWVLRMLGAKHIMAPLLQGSDVKQCVVDWRLQENRA